MRHSSSLVDADFKRGSTRSDIPAPWPCASHPRSTSVSPQLVVRESSHFLIRSVDLHIASFPLPSSGQSNGNSDGRVGIARASSHSDHLVVNSQNVVELHKRQTHMWATARYNFNASAAPHMQLPDIRIFLGAQPGVSSGGSVSPILHHPVFVSCP